ncbi:MAG TPA: tetratricopeptide repeat protein, partial [Myxococcota bacterium]|nr:tetratricopeptide repeat protein [Myxococcota bacterium]
RMHPERPDAHILWGRALAQNDQLAESIPHYEEARQLGSRDPRLFAELASAYDVAKKYPEAAAVYRDYLIDHPTDVVMRDELALTLLLLGQVEAAVAELERAVQVAPDNLQVQQDLGYAYLSAGAYEKARDTLRAVLGRDNTRPDAARLLAQAEVGLGHVPEAMHVLDVLLAAYPRDRAAASLREKLAHGEVKPPER